MFRRGMICLTVCVALVCGLGLRKALALGGTVQSPQVGITVDAQGKQDPVGIALQQALTRHKDQFANGWFINALTVMYFRGETTSLNAMLQDLAEVEGATIVVKFSKELGVSENQFVQGNPDMKPCQWSIQHNAWDDAHQLSVTIYLGDDTLQIQDIVLPKIHGKAPKAEPAEETD